MDTRRLKPLLQAFDLDWRYRPYERMRFFLSGIRNLWGLPTQERVPEDAEEGVLRAIEAYSQLVAAESPFEDILGPLYMELASHGSKQHMGQFFTPYEIAKMMNLMTIGEALPQDRELVTVCDPACGSGVMLLSFLQIVLEKFGPEALKRISVTGVDLDAICVDMCATQLLANCNIHRLQVGEILIVRGNSLTLEHMGTVLHATAPGTASTESALSRLTGLRPPNQEGQGSKPTRPSQPLSLTLP